MNMFRKTFYTSISKRLLISLLAIGMAGHLTGCAMGGSSDEEAGASGDETFAEESSGDFAEGEEPAEGEEAPADGEVAEGDAAPAEGDDLESEVAEAGADAAPGEGDDLGGDDLGGDDLAMEGDDELAGDLAAEGDDELSLDDEGGLPSEVAGNDAPPIIDEPAAAPTDAPVFAEAAPEAPVDAAPAEPKVWAPLKKMKTAAFDAGGSNLNRVYVSRPGDTKQGVAEKLYGDKKRAKDLSKWNGFLSRGVKTGDKIYYSSPTNPTDSNMMTYYEDVGVPAQNYVTRDGDNIREVAKTLLGDKESWKEIWVTNQDIESKGDLASGLNIRYWPEGSTPAPVMAGMEDPPPQDPTGMDPLAGQQPPLTGNPDPLAIPPADPLAAGTGLPPGDPVAMNPPDPIAAPTGTPASEAPPVVGSTEQPPPTEKPPRPVAVDPSLAGTEEADNMMMMGLGGIVLLAAGAVYFLMRSRRSRKVDLTQTTQVG